MSYYYYYLLFILITIYCLTIGFASLINEQTPLPVPDLIRSNSYPVEAHRITTEDGYILELHRIPQGRTGNFKHIDASRPVAFLVHCLLGSSAIWVKQGPPNGLGYILADNGFDVWMLNTRGTSYSKRHARYPSSSSQFWEFSMHEQAIYDVSAGIDYALNYTKQRQLDYVGHSMGTTLFFMLMSTRKEYNDKIRNMVALAPAVFMTHGQGYLSYSGFADLMKNFPESFNSNKISHFLCNQRVLFRLPCAAGLKMILGSTTRNVDEDKLGYFLSYYPDTTAMRTVLHYYQIKNSGKFQLYDYGAAKNFELYNSSVPPQYNLGQVTAPVHIIESEGDLLTTPEDIASLRTALPSVVSNYKIVVPDFSHMDYIWGEHVRQIVYERVLDILLGRQRLHYGGGQVTLPVHIHSNPGS